MDLKGVISSPPSELAKLLMECFKQSPEKLAPIAELADIQTKLMIKQKPDIPIDAKVSANTLTQFTKTLCNLGDQSAITNELAEVKANLANISELKGQIKQFINSKKDRVNLNAAKKLELRKKIEDNKRQQKELQKEYERKLEEMTPKLDYEERLQSEFCEMERSKNVELKKNIEALEKKYPECFKNINTEADLVKLIDKQELEYNNLIDLSVEDSNGTQSRLSFSYDNSRVFDDTTGQ